MQKPLVDDFAAPDFFNARCRVVDDDAMAEGTLRQPPRIQLPPRFLLAAAVSIV